jgi:hypothetical protein
MVALQHINAVRSLALISGFVYHLVGSLLVTSDDRQADHGPKFSPGTLIEYFSKSYEEASKLGELLFV